MSIEINRRELGFGVAALGTALVARPMRAGAGTAKVVVVGGGPGGATLAGTLKRASPALNVTLIEAQRSYTTCFQSNFYLAGLRSYASLTHTYEGLERAGIGVIHDRATGIDTMKQTVRLGSGADVSYDRLVLAPGIAFEFDAIEGLNDEAVRRMPHAWSGGAQLRSLRHQLMEMPDGGLVLIAAPRDPYRCPPGPYERACAIAHYLKTAKPRSKLVILDAKMAFSKQALFEEAFATYYKDVIELYLTNDIDDMSVLRVDARTGEVVTKAGAKFTAAVANIIPDQRAGDIAVDSGLARGGWCPINPENFRSTLSDKVYVLGDSAAAAEMPKSAFSANSQAIAVAADILADLTGQAPPAVRYRNTCWSLLAPGDSVKIGADYAPGAFRGRPMLLPSNGFISKPGESRARRKEVFDESLAWYETLVASVFMEERGFTEESEEAGASRRHVGPDTLEH